MVHWGSGYLKETAGKSPTSNSHLSTTKLSRPKWHPFCHLLQLLPTSIPTTGVSLSGQTTVTKSTESGALERTQQPIHPPNENPNPRMCCLSLLGTAPNTSESRLPFSVHRRMLKLPAVISSSPEMGLELLIVPLLLTPLKKTSRDRTSSQVCIKPSRVLLFGCWENWVNENETLNLTQINNCKFFGNQ